MNSYTHSSLGDHLDDLRQTLIRIGIVVFLGFVLALYFHQNLFELLTPSWQINKFSTLSKQEIKQIRVFNHSSDNQLFFLPTNAQVIQQTHSHLDSTTPGLYKIKSQGYVDYLLPHQPQLLFLSPSEGLIQTCKVCFWLSLALTAPLWGWLAFQFIAPGLHGHEKAIFIPFTLLSTLCMGLGGLLAYFITIPLANHYLASFNESLGQNAWTFAHYMDYTLFIFFGHIIAFEIGLLLLLMVHFHILPYDWLIAKRRYMIVFAFILAAILTPPDVLTQFTLAIPLIGFYELIILYGKYKTS